MVKEFLRERGIDFELRDVTVDSAALDDFVRAGYRLPPVTLVGDQAVEGYNPGRLDALLGFSDSPS